MIIKLNIIKNKIFYFFLLCVLHQFLSIGSFINLDYANLKFENIINYRNQSVLILLINLIIFFYLKKKIQNIFLGFIFLALSYFIGYLNFFFSLNNNYNNNIEWHLTFIVQIISTAFIFNNIYYLFNKNNIKSLFLVVFVFFVFYLLYFFFSDSVARVSREFFLNYKNFSFNTNINGISRILVFISTLLTTWVILKKKNFIYFILIIFINYLIFKYQSRTAFVLLTLQHIILLIIYKKIKTKLISNYAMTSLLFILPLMIHFASFGTEKSRIFLLQGEINIENNNIKNNNIKNNNIINQENLDTFSTGRLKKINLVFNKLSNKVFLFGGGPEYDRFFFLDKVETRDVNNQKNTAKQGQDISNGFIYVLMCGGYLGVIAYIFIIFQTLNLIIKYLLKFKYFSDFLSISSIIISISLLLRSLVENGLASYGIDFLLLNLCILYLKFSIKSKQQTG